MSLTPKAVETLLVLVQQNGRLVEREQLMNAIWPDTFVEDGNLNFNVSVLRKALGTDEAGEQYIQTVPRHGYRFNADVREVAEEVPALIVEKHTRARVVVEEREFPGADRDGGRKGRVTVRASCPETYSGFTSPAAVALMLAIGAVGLVCVAAKGSTESAQCSRRRRFSRLPFCL